MIHLISVNNNKITGSRCSPIRILKQYLQVRNIKVRTYDFWYKTEITDYGFVQELHHYDKISEAIKGNINIDEDEMLRDIVDLANDIEVNDNDIFGFSNTVISYYYMIVFSIIIKKRNPKVKTVFGGYHVSLGNKFGKFLLDNNLSDFIVKGDGCRPLYDIYNNNVEGRELKGDFISDLWPDFDIIDSHLSNGILGTVTSYGCNNNCYFCASDRRFYNCDMTKFENYLIKMVGKGFNKVELNDDNPNVTSQKFSEISDIMDRVGIKDWMSFVNPINVAKTSTLKRVMMGAECFSDRLFKIINKKQTVKQILKSIDFYMENDIDVFCNMIIGLPNEDEIEFEKTISVIETLTIKYGSKISFWPTSFRVFPGSYMYYNPKKFGITYSYWDDTDIPKEYFIEGLTKDIVDKRIEYISTNFPSKLIYSMNNKSILIKRGNND